MAKKASGRRRAGFTLPLAVVAGFASPVSRTWGHFRSNGLTGEEGAVAEFSRTMIGINPYANPVQFESWRLRYGLYPVVLGLLVHKVASWVGINRMIAQAHVPVVRI